MSIQHVSAVLDSRHTKLTGCRKLVLVTLANRTDAQGKCWPSQQLIADECGISVRTLSDHLKGLEEDGFITRTTKHLGKGNGSRTSYAIQLQKLVVAPEDIAHAEVAPAELAHAIYVGCTGSSPRVTNLQEPSVTIEAKASIVGELPISQPSKRDPKGSRLSEDWVLPDDWLSEAQSIAVKSNQFLTPHEVRHEADKFRDYWHSKPGAAGRKTNWLATWRNWVRSALERRPARNAPGHNGSHANGEHRGGSIADAAIRARLRRENGNGVHLDGGRRSDVPSEAPVIDGQYRLVG